MKNVASLLIRERILDKRRFQERKNCKRHFFNKTIIFNDLLTIPTYAYVIPRSASAEPNLQHCFYIKYGVFPYICRY